VIPEFRKPSCGATRPLLTGDVRHLLLIVALALSLRLAWMWYAQPVPVSDFAEYAEWASALLQHHQYGYPQPTAYRSPGYPFFLAGLMLVSNSVTWLSLVNVLLAAPVCVLLYALGKSSDTAFSIYIHRQQARFHDLQAPLRHQSFSHERCRRTRHDDLRGRQNPSTQ
jgi:hypothetical protein